MEKDNKYKELEHQIEVLTNREHNLGIVNSFALMLIDIKTVDEIVWSVAKEAVGKLGFEDCIVYLFDDNKEKLIQRAAHGPKNPERHDIIDPLNITLGKGIVGTVAQTGIGEIIPDTRKDKRYIMDKDFNLSEITVPLIFDDEIIGVIDCEAKEANFFNEEDFDLLSTISILTAHKLHYAMEQEKSQKKQEALQKELDKKNKHLERTIKKLKRSYDDIFRQDSEKEILLKEIHHRVKNNMQIISSLLNIHINTTENKNEIKVFRESQSRIRSMALVHERLYAEGDLAKISVFGYIKELFNELLYSYDATHHINIELDVEDTKLDIDTFIPLGLILNELTVNALKHAFPDKQKGIISIGFKKNFNQVTLDYADNGIGLPENLDFTNNESLGLELIETLVFQLDGAVKIIPTDRGAHFRVTFNT